MSFFKKIKKSVFSSSTTSSSTTSPTAQNYTNKKFNNLSLNLNDTNTTLSNVNNTNGNATFNNATLNSSFSNTSSSFNTKYTDNNNRNLVIYHIDSETEGAFHLTVKNDDLGDYILNRVCDHFNLTDYKEYFGLKYTLVDDKGDYEIFWLDPLKLVGKQLKHTNNVLTFRVKHFPGKPEQIESEYVRYLIFLQIRNYLLKGDLQLSLNDEVKLAAYAVQASLGDYDADIHKDDYLKELKFLSTKTLKSKQAISDIHKQLKGKNPAEMELAFLEKASQFDTYGAELIVLKNSKGVSINFGASHNGIITFLHGQTPNLAKVGLYPWTQIGKISYEGKTLKVHAHTPDNKNPEIIKKHVMVFKCNSKRICKHLWKFVLDQKAFFNFKRGVDVPRIKSSSSLFSHKSKFRFSGRCESELIASQNEKSLLSISPLSINDSSNENSFNTSTNNPSTIARSATLHYPDNGKFKRRTFLSSYRPTASLPRNGILNTSITITTSPQTTTNTNKNITSDSNNNNLLLKQVDSSSNLNTSQTSSNATAIRKNTLNQSETGSQQTAFVLNNANDSNSSENNTSAPSTDSNNTPKLTSTPQMSANKQNTKKEEIDFKKESDEEKFYDHDDFRCNNQSQKNSDLDSNLSNEKKLVDISNQFLVNNLSNNKHKSKVNSIFKNYRLIITITCFGLLTYWVLSSYKSESSILSRLNNNINLSLQSIKNRLGYFITGNNNYELNSRWVRWPIVSTSTNLDPLFSWFFSKYQQN